MTIPASAIVNVIPGVLNAGGNALQLLGVCVTDNAILPYNTLESFTSATQVGAFFGTASLEYAKALVYFAGYDGKTAIPAAMPFVRWSGGGLSAFLRSGNVAALGLTALQAINASLTITVDGYARTGSVNLSSATSFTAAAGIIQTAVNGSMPTEASFTGVIAPESASFTASINGNVMTVTGSVTGTIVEGSLLAGTGVTSGTTIGAQLSGTAGGAGTYAVSKAQLVASEALTASYGQLTASGTITGTISVGQEVVGGSTAAGTIITALGTGVGAAGTYFVNLTQTVSSGSLTTQPVPVTVGFDSTTNGFTVTSGVTGAASTVAYASGAAAASLLMTSATGAILSQGTEGLLPGSFMNNVIKLTQNWATFFTTFDPDGGNTSNVQKLLFSAWVNSTSNRFAYICVDKDASPSASTNAAASMGQILAASQSSGTILIWEPATGGPYNQAPFVAGMIASINYEAENGSITLFGKHQQGLVATVSDQTIAANLDANFYNYYGAYATANQGFIFFNKGVISGPFEWANTYANQIWLNSQFQLDLMEYLTTVGSSPYNQPGYAAIEASCFSTIEQALTNGVIVPGVTLSSLEVLEVNTQAGKNVAGTIQTQGWYMQVQPATPQVRAARTTPPIYFWYTDGGSCQQLTLNSLDVQ